MKRKMLFLIFFITSAVAMNPDDPERNLLTLKDFDAALATAITVGDIRAVKNLGKRFTQAEPTSLKRRRKTGAEVTLTEALNAAQRNLAQAEKNLTWLGNTGRMYYVSYGVLAVLLGLGKGAYDISQFWNHDVDPTKNGFSVGADAMLLTGGYFYIKEAFENGSSRAEYDKAVTTKLFVETLAKSSHAKVHVSSSTSSRALVSTAPSSSLNESAFSGDSNADSTGNMSGEEKRGTLSTSRSSFLSTE
jgi:hypothetical protein